jgi:hypothetical protein
MRRLGVPLENYAFLSTDGFARVMPFYDEKP